jgi:hypothetical protein
MIKQEMKAMKKIDSSMQGLICYICIIASMLLNGLFGVTHGTVSVLMLCLSAIVFSIGVLELLGVTQNLSADTRL